MESISSGSMHWALDLRQVLIDHSWKLGATFDAAECRPLPLATSHKLEGTRRNLLACSCYSNDCRHAPTLEESVKKRKLGEYGERTLWQASSAERITLTLPVQSLISSL